MTFQTLYNIKDTVFYMSSNKVESGEITEIKFNVYLGVSGIQSKLEYGFKERLDRMFPESELFPTKEALLQSL